MYLQVSDRRYILKVKCGKSYFLVSAMQFLQIYLARLKLLNFQNT